MNIEKLLNHHRLLTPMGDEATGEAGGGLEQGAPDRGDELPPMEGKEQEEPEADKNEGKAEEQDSTDSGKKGKDFIPLERHKDILERERARRQQLEQQLEQASRTNHSVAVDEAVQKKEASILDMEKKMHEHMLAGENEKAAELMTRIRHAEREVLEAKNEVRYQEAEARAVERARYDIVVERMEAAYPALNPDADDFDQEATAEVLELQQGFMAAGRSATDALQRAVKYVMGNPQTSAQKTAVDVTPRVPKGDIEQQRRAQAAGKTADAMSRTPPSTASIGLDNGKLGGSAASVDISKLSYEEFLKLPEATISKMRGD